MTSRMRHLLLLATVLAILLAGPPGTRGEYINSNGLRVTDAGVIMVMLSTDPAYNPAQTIRNSRGFLTTFDGKLVIDGTNLVTGPGTVNYLPKFTTTTALGDSLVSDDDTTLTYTGTGGITTNGTSGLLNLTCSATTPVAAGDVRCVTGAPATLQYFGAAAQILVGRATADTLTNKTLDVEGTGNVLTTVQSFSFEGVCQAAANASFPFDTDSSGAGAAACITGTNVKARAVWDLDPTTDEHVQGSFRLPKYWVGAIDVDVEAQANEASTASARLGIKVSCVGASEAYDQAFGTADTWAWTGDGTANHRIVSVKTGIATVGCAAGERLFFDFYRDADGTSGTDDLAADLRVVALQFTTRKTK